MKYLIPLAILSICLPLALLLSAGKQVASDTQILPPDIVVKQSEKSEEQVFCVPQYENKTVYCIKYIWTVNEYASGKIKLHEQRDTLWTQKVSLTDPCPGNSFSLSMR